MFFDKMRRYIMRMILKDISILRPPSLDIVVTLKPNNNKY